MSTVAVLRAEVQRLFGDESATFLEAADVLTWLNRGQLDIARRTDCLVTEMTGTTVAGVNFVAEPTDVLGYKQISLDYVVQKEYQFEQRLVTSSSFALDVPYQRYILWNNKIYFSGGACAAAVNYRIYYTRTPVALVADTDVPEIPVQYHEDLVRFCLARANEMAEDFNAADRFMADYQQRVSSIRSDTDNQSRQSYAAVRCIDDWDY